MCVLLRIPKRFHGKVDPFTGLDFDMKDVVVNREVGLEQTLDIALATKKSAIVRQIKQLSGLLSHQYDDPITMMIVSLN